MSGLSSVRGRDLNWVLETWLARQPGNSFLHWAPPVGAPASWTWAEFVRDCRALASGLQKRGIRKGDLVALVLDNRPDFLLSWAAVVSVGAVAVCLNPASSHDELAYVDSHSGPAAAIATAENVDVVAAAMPGLRWVAVSTLERTGHGSESLAALYGAPEQFRRIQLSPLDPASIQYTSGTTARPKAVVWTQANVLWAGRSGARHQQLTPTDVNLLHLPLFHTNALSYSFLSTLWSGGSIVLQPKFSASRFWDVAGSHRCTWSSMVSFCLRALANTPGPAAHHFRGWGNSSTISRSASPFGIPVMGWFGMTETVSHPICSSPDHPDADGTMGRPSSGYGVAVVDDSGVTADVGVTGNLKIRGVRGVSLFQEYLHAPDVTARAFDEEGWFLTGDRVRVNEDGSISFVERDKDVLKVGGENVGAAEIERVILAMKEVREVAVVGKTHAMLGEVPVAFVMVAPGSLIDETQVRRQCETALPRLKWPREVRIVDNLPRATLDKIAKAQLRRQLEAGSLND